MSECKHDGCLEPVINTRGMYAGLCEFHRNQAKHDRAATNSNGHVDIVAAAERLQAARETLREAEAEFQRALADLGYQAASLR